MSLRAAVFGAGSWGTAFSMILADAGCEVSLWGRRLEVVDAINGSSCNPYYFPGVTLPGGIKATSDPEEASSGADAIFLCTPAQTLRANLAAWAPFLDSKATLVSLIKGVELGTGKLMSQVIAEVAGCDPKQIAVISGPNLAREIVARQPAAGVVACADGTVAVELQKMCHAPYYRPYTSADLIGCEIGGAVKNVIALATGIAEGCGLGENAKATLVTRGLAETARLAAAMGAESQTLAGLAGVGDLVATCASPLSRNHALGVKLGEGMSISQAISMTKQTAEGVSSAKAVVELARNRGVEMPITAAVVAIIEERMTTQNAIEDLMGRSVKPERDDAEQ
ncbi:NAD(P)H-dependent glycerol-3-phosphate dehydrogenase [Amycolatopsis halotolerans]|uniref:Glycerol-3-phosphate dehydrogenase [NAD(P)+] n=2 Tax=Amycolatopsis halotolerans TaxID=330083 RepID=A0ABV7QEU3_9PSEU